MLQFKSPAHRPGIISKLEKNLTCRLNVKSKTIELPGVGKILLERSSRARHVRLSVRPFKGARVAVPQGVSYARAEQFARSKSGWLGRQLARMARMERRAAALTANASINWSAAEKWLIQRLDELSAQHGFNYQRVVVKCQKTRWGSCSAKNNISLNINLIRLPADLIDYILLHELVHTRVKDHSRRFWNELEKFVGNARRLDGKLNEYGALLF